MSYRVFDLQGHRGARGLVPENTLPGFAAALALGVTTLETDLAVTRDGIVVLSHDQRLDPQITRGPDGRWIAGPGPSIHTLTRAELDRYDVGRIDPASPYAARFPLQRPIDGTRIPSLTDLFALGERSPRPPRYNIEIKTSPLTPDDTPTPELFASLVVTEIRKARLEHRVTIQSFDWRALLAVRDMAPEIVTSGLTITSPEMTNVEPDDEAPNPWLSPVADRLPVTATAPEIAAAAGCRIWSPYALNLDATSVAQAHALHLDVIPWTINEPDDIAHTIALGVDGLITDYPDRAMAILHRLGRTVA